MSYRAKQRTYYLGLFRTPKDVTKGRVLRVNLIYCSSRSLTFYSIFLIFEVSEVSNLSTRSTLLEMSQDKKTPPTASELFKDSTNRHSKDEDFFDSLGSRGDGGKKLERPVSELCLAQHQEDNSDALQHSSSQNDLATLQNQQHENSPAHLQNTESMQSIALSRDSLLAEPHNVSVDYSILSTETGASIPYVSAEVTDQNKLPLQYIAQQQQSMHEHQVSTTSMSLNQNQISSQQNQMKSQQQQQQQQQYQQYQQPSIDHMQSFDNPALAVEGNLNSYDNIASEAFPEQPAIIHSTYVNQVSCLFHHLEIQFKLIKLNLFFFSIIFFCKIYFFHEIFQIYNKIQDHQVVLDPDQEQKRRGCSFWQPSPHTEQLLAQYQHGSTLEPNLLTNPSVLVETMMV